MGVVVERFEVFLITPNDPPRASAKKAPLPPQLLNQPEKRFLIINGLRLGGRLMKPLAVIFPDLPSTSQFGRGLWRRWDLRFPHGFAEQLRRGRWLGCGHSICPARARS